MRNKIVESHKSKYCCCCELALSSHLWTKGKVAVERTEVSLVGFIQPRPFVKHMLTLVNAADGLWDRILLFPSFQEILPMEIVMEHNEVMKKSPVTNLDKVYNDIYTSHLVDNVTYTFSPEAQEEFKLFANKISQTMNQQITFGTIV